MVCRQCGGRGTIREQDMQTFFDHPCPSCAFTARLHELVRVIRYDADQLKKRSNDKQYSEWVRDRAYGQAAGMNSCASLLSSLLDETK